LPETTKYQRKGWSSGQISCRARRWPVSSSNVCSFDGNQSADLRHEEVGVTDADGDVYFHMPGIAKVSWDRNRELVLVEWEGWANSREFAALLDAELRALNEHQGSRMLADCREQRVLSPVDQERADREWLPLALAAGLMRFAIVLPHSVLAAMNLQERLSKVPGGTLEIAYFEQVDEAAAWATR